MSQDQVMVRRQFQTVTGFADAHCHLNLFPDPRKAVEDALSSGVGLMLATGGSGKDNRECIGLADGINVFAVVGISPDNAETDAAEIDGLEELVMSSKHVVGIGEIGLDAKETERVSMEAQLDAFARQVDIANRLNLPVVIHSRGGTLGTVAEMLASRNVRRVMFHFFEGDAMQAKILAAKGNLISIPPAMTSRRKRVIKELNLNSIATETDSPVVGKSPSDVIAVTEAIAREKGISTGAAASAITENIRTLFSIY